VGTVYACGVETFDFGFDPRYRRWLALLGIRPDTAVLALTDDDRLSVTFGRWRLDTPLSNVVGTQVTGGYQWYKAIGARGSFADRGVTFGTNCDRGICALFREPVPCLLPGRSMLHPGMTATVADCDRLVASLEERCDLEPCPDGTSGSLRRRQR
jgi:hypothetical protein